MKVESSSGVVGLVLHIVFILIQLIAIQHLTIINIVVLKIESVKLIVSDTYDWNEYTHSSAALLQ